MPVSPIYFQAACPFPVVGVLLSALSIHVLQILTIKVYSKRNNGRVKPQAHLLTVWVAAPTMAVGVVIADVSVHGQPHMDLAAVWAVFVSSITIVTTAAKAYCLISQLKLAGEVAALDKRGGYWKASLSITLGSNG